MTPKITMPSGWWEALKAMDRLIAEKQALTTANIGAILNLSRNAARSKIISMSHYDLTEVEKDEISTLYVPTNYGYKQLAAFNALDCDEDRKQFFSNRLRKL